MPRKNKPQNPLTFRANTDPGVKCCEMRKAKKGVHNAKYPAIHFFFFAFYNRFRVFRDKCIADLRINKQSGSQLWSECGNNKVKVFCDFCDVTYSRVQCIFIVSTHAYVHELFENEFKSVPVPNNTTITSLKNSRNKQCFRQIEKLKITIRMLENVQHLCQNMDEHPRLSTRQQPTALY